MVAIVFPQIGAIKRWLCIPPNYGFSLEKLQCLPLLHRYLPMKINCVPWVDWQLKDGKQVT